MMRQYEYVDLSDECEYALNECVSKSSVDSIMRNCSLDFSNVPYKQLADEARDEVIDGKKVTLLPMGLINDKVRHFLEMDIKNIGKRRGLALFKNLITTPNEFKTLYYPEFAKAATKEQLTRICKSYIEYYRDSLDETWSDETFYEMFSELKYLTVKYAQGEDEEPYVIGFFGAYERSGATGKCLTNAELYVMPEYRKMGIAKRLVGLSFDQAKANGVESFDSITYRIENQNALAFWEKVGANVSGLIHIEGDVSEMLEKINEDVKLKK
ncbi:MAG: GNAT family N-acetyltransferase [Bacilli bacterium]|nr:GNAT family N-acetyltransferase [Bacilli bacterium]